jgi:hypothetical protein
MILLSCSALDTLSATRPCGVSFLFLLHNRGWEGIGKTANLTFVDRARLAASQGSKESECCSTPWVSMELSPYIADSDILLCRKLRI